MKRQYKEADHIPGVVLYYCNPEKNIGCTKSMCMYNINAIDPCCELTSCMEYALEENEKVRIKAYPRPKKNGF